MQQPRNRVSREPKAGTYRSTTAGPGRVPQLIFLVAAVLATGASYRTRNFLVTADDAELARRVAVAAEQHRRGLSRKWFGVELPPWKTPCPIRVRETTEAGTNGRTSFVFVEGRPTDWRMTIQGPSRRIFDSVLPHEIAHTVFATHFGRPLPRWVEEGICVAVEHHTSQTRLQRLAVSRLRSGKAIALPTMFEMADYPSEILSFYSQGYSLTRFLIQLGGEQKLIHYISDGLESNDWGGATRKHYGFATLADLQRAWVAWVLPKDV